jgi:hypothetical protein
MEQQRKAAPVQLPPILIIDHLSRSDGRRLFEESNTEEFSKKATTRREAQGQCSKHHAGHWQAAAAAAAAVWKGLTDEERDNLEQKAKITGSVKERSIYQYVIIMLHLHWQYTSIDVILAETRRLSCYPCSSFSNPTKVQALDKLKIPRFIFFMVSVVKPISWNMEGMLSSLLRFV